ncbi:unnamed protein product [Rhodiola kirilowii]
MQSERPSSLSSWPSLSAYVHDHQSVVVRSCSDEPTTRSESDSDHQYQQQQQQRRRRECEQEAENENEGNSGVGFEFSFYCAEAMSSPISADQIFHNGRIKPTVPIYEVARVYPEQEDRKSTEVDDQRLKVAVEKMTIQKTSRRKALRRLFMEEKEKHSSPAPFITTSTSSSDTDEATSELESVPSDTYCVWKPKTSSDSNPNEICKKSEPLSKRWKLKDILTRNSSSSSEKDSQSQSQSQTQSSSSSNNSKNNEKEVRAAPQLARKMAMKEGVGGGERRKSYLPYRQELVGIFGSSGSGRNLQRF